MSVATRPAPPLVTTPAIRRGTAFGVGLALLSTIAVYVVGNLGAPIRVVTGWSPEGADLTLVEVVLTATAAVVLGALALWLLERRRSDGLRIWELVAAALAVLSAAPLLRLDVDRGSKISLVAMHLLTGVAAIAGHRIARRGPTQRRGLFRSIVPRRRDHNERSGSDTREHIW
jgi:hypothetical protein